MLLAIELFFVGLLVLASLAIGYISLVVLYNLFRGQR
jgi:hypothetical protein